jgi:hypothetical protein
VVRAVMAWWRKKIVLPARRVLAAVSTRVVRARNTGTPPPSATFTQQHSTDDRAWLHHPLIGGYGYSIYQLHSQ